MHVYCSFFQYHMIPGSGLFVPVMSLAETQRQTTVEDPVAKALRQGKPPTLKDVKMSVKVSWEIPSLNDVFRLTVK